MATVTIPAHLTPDNEPLTLKAHDLLMRKEFAWQILRGEKRLEFRTWNNFYISRFLDKDFNIRPMHGIHFHDYNKSWFLDVGVLHLKHIGCTSESLKFMHDFGHYEWDDDIAQTPKAERKYVLAFAFPIISILGTNLCEPSQIPCTGGVIGPIKDTIERAKKWYFPDVEDIDYFTMAITTAAPCRDPKELAKSDFSRFFDIDKLLNVGEKDN